MIYQYLFDVIIALMAILAFIISIISWKKSRVHYSVQTAYTGAPETPQSYVDDLLKTGRYQILHATYIYEPERKEKGQQERGYIYVLADCKKSK